MIKFKKGSFGFKQIFMSSRMVTDIARTGNPWKNKFTQSAFRQKIWFEVCSARCLRQTWNPRTLPCSCI